LADDVERSRRPKSIRSGMADIREAQAAAAITKSMLSGRWRQAVSMSAARGGYSVGGLGYELR
jgi:hypothetical protein